MTALDRARDALEALLGRDQLDMLVAEASGTRVESVEERARRFEPIHLPRIFVLITSVQWRKPSLERVLDALKHQTVQPDVICLKLDGYSDDEAKSYFEALGDDRRVRAYGIHEQHHRLDEIDPRDGLQRVVVDDSAPENGISSHWWPNGWDGPGQVYARSFRKAGGAGYRWRHESLNMMHDQDILFTLDDDLVPAPDYLKRTAKIIVTENCAVTWHGWTVGPENEWPDGAYFKKAPMDLPAVSIGAGVAAFRWGWVKDLAEHPLGPLCLYAGAKCDDDALLALHLWQKGVKVIRPKGDAPVTETEFSRAPTASFNTHGAYRHGQRLALAIAYGCPMLNIHIPPHPGIEQGFIEACEFLEKHGHHDRDRARDAARRAVALAPHFRELRGRTRFAEFLMPHLDEVEARESIGVLGIGSMHLWLPYYTAVRGIDLVTYTTIPQLAAEQRKITRHEIVLTDTLDQAPERKHRLLIVPAIHWPPPQQLVHEGTEVVKLAAKED